MIGLHSPSEEKRTLLAPWKVRLAVPFSNYQISLGEGRGGMGEQLIHLFQKWLGDVRTVWSSPDYFLPGRVTDGI